MQAAEGAAALSEVTAITQSPNSPTIEMTSSVSLAIGSAVCACGPRFLEATGIYPLRVSMIHVCIG